MNAGEGPLPGDVLKTIPRAYLTSVQEQVTWPFGWPGRSMVKQKSRHWITAINLTYKNPDREKFLNEIYRVLKSQGKFVIIESSQPHNALVRSLFRIYLKVFVAGIGGWLSGHKGAYRYLAASARNFYKPAEIKQLLSVIGFSRVEYRPFFGGIAGLTVATK
jgi:ubiquinone/menaquinone biosynthesis C-methylase UbiE